MNNKQILKNKVGFLEQSLLEADWTIKQMALRIDAMQEQIDKYKKSGDKKDLEQNNDLIIDLIKKRLDIGAEQYHQNVPIMPRDDITRDNFYEAVEEALDLSVYLSAYMLRLMEEKERREFEPTTADEHNHKEKDENREEEESSA
jgi:hypothetical protein|tara:strand:- start:12682 stop:13116 length:435 start_codon:yes stop_codon:yes gene_type:complete